MKLFESRKFQVWGCVSLMFLISLGFLSPDGRAQVFVLAWAGFFTFTSSILTLHLGGKIAGRHQEGKSEG